MSYSLSGKRVWVAGHRGMVGSSILRRLSSEGCEALTVSKDEVDLRDLTAVSRWIGAVKPEAVFMAAAKVGGIYANDSQPAEFLFDNLAIAANVTHACHVNGVEKLLFLGSSCIYPKFASQPIVEDSLLTGPLEPTNEWYAVAKIAGVKLCQAYRRQYGDDYISAMPTNLYGPGDNYDLNSSHVLPALIRKFDDAKRNSLPSVSVWGSGNPLREFMHVDDLANACVFLMKNYSAEQHINVGSGHEIAIRDLAKLVADIVGYEGEVVQDRSKPDGTPRKLMDSSRLRELGWAPSRTLREGIVATYRDFCLSHEVK